jgi:hypothetical protein
LVPDEPPNIVRWLSLLIGIDLNYKKASWNTQKHPGCFRGGTSEYRSGGNRFFAYDDGNELNSSRLHFFYAAIEHDLLSAEHIMRG